MSNSRDDGPIELSEIHHRVFRSTMMILERRIIDYVCYLFLSKYRSELPDSVQLPYDDDIKPEEKEVLMENLTQLSILAESFSRTFNLERSSRSLRQRFRAQAYKIWEDLENSYSKQLKGYGDLEPNIREKLDAFIDEMEEINDRIIKLFNDET